MGGGPRLWRRRLRDAAQSRAVNGVARPVFYKGEQIGERRYYDERLTMFILRLRFGSWRDRTSFVPEADSRAELAENLIYDTEAQADCRPPGTTYIRSAVKPRRRRDFGPGNPISRGRILNFLNFRVMFRASGAAAATPAPAVPAPRRAPAKIATASALANGAGRRRCRLPEAQVGHDRPRRDRAADAGVGDGLPL